VRTVGDGVKLAGTKADLAVRRFALSELARAGTGAHLQSVAFTFRTHKCVSHVSSAAHILGCGGSGTEVVQSAAKLAPKGSNKIMLEKTKIFSQFCVLVSTVVEFRD